MINRMLCFGLVFIPFYEVITTLFLPAQSIAFFDTRFPKECVAFSIALAIIIYGLYTGSIKAIRNKWLMLFLGFLVVSLNKVPVVPIDLAGFEISNFWVWKPFMQILVYFFMLSVICSTKWHVKKAAKIFQVMAWCGFIMALYIFIQKLRLDQFFYQRPYAVVLGTAAPDIGGTMGAASLIAPFLALCLIPAIFLRKVWFALAISAAVILTQSDMAIFAMVASLLIYFFAHDPRKLWTAIIVIVMGGYFCFFVNIEDANRKIFNDNGRVSIWKNMVHDLSSPFSAKDPRRFALTGFGLGSFEHVYNLKHPTNSSQPPRQAHNEYLELIWCVGLIGMALFLAAGWTMFAPLYSLFRIDREAVCLASMMVVLGVCAAGSFIWHLAVYQFYTVVIVGMIYSLRESYGKSVD